MSLDATTETAPIVSERCVLRPVRLSDVGLISHYSGDERLARMTKNIPHPLPPGASAAYLDRVTKPDCPDLVLAMDDTARDGPELMGLATLCPMDRNQAVISFWTAPPFWNTGLARAAIGALIDANPLGCDTIFADVFQDSPASARVLTHCGFEYLGDAEAFCVARNAPVATWTYIRRM